MLSKEAWKRIFAEFPFLMGIKRTWNRQKDMISVTTLEDPKVSAIGNRQIFGLKHPNVVFLFSNEDEVSFVDCSDLHDRTVAEHFGTIDGRIREHGFCEIFATVYLLGHDSNGTYLNVEIYYGRGKNVLDLLSSP